jgi:hypothetical protein
MYCSPNDCQGLLSFSLPCPHAAAEHKAALPPPSQHMAMGLPTHSKGNGIAAQILNHKRL